jgi:hypothetical protein
MACMTATIVFIVESRTTTGESTIGEFDPSFSFFPTCPGFSSLLLPGSKVLQRHLLWFINRFKWSGFWYDFFLIRWLYKTFVWFSATQGEKEDGGGTVNRVVSSPEVTAA